MSILLLALILTGAIVLFVTEWVRVDLVALLILAALVLSGILTPGEALLGFSSPATVTVACMFVLSAALTRSGALDPVSDWIARVGRGRPMVLLALLILAAGPLSAFINNTAVVAIFLPATTVIARREGVSASKLLIPMAFSTQFGGVSTGCAITSPRSRSRPIRRWPFHDTDLASETGILGRLPRPVRSDSGLPAPAALRVPPGAPRDATNPTTDTGLP